MKTLLVALLAMATSAFAADTIKIYTIANASSYDMTAIYASFGVGNLGEPRVEIIAHRQDYLRDHPELSYDYFTATVHGLTASEGIIRLVHDGVHTCAVKTDSRFEETGACELKVEKTTGDAIEVSIVVNR